VVAWEASRVESVYWDASSPYVFPLTLYVGRARCGESSTLSTSFRAIIVSPTPYAPENVTISCSWERLATLKRLFGMVATCWTVTVGWFGV
ncbi:hypothetical protein K469DRAFT_700374, partial [Zopfia rhizophila CBS 207.26]